MTQANGRKADHTVEPVFLERWSPRAFTGAPIPEAEIKSILEAARWAPSAYNSQPWRFLYARRDTPHWEKFLGLLNEFNRSWAKNASAIVYVVSKGSFAPPGADKEQPSYTASYDAGAAWANLALQATKLGWIAHGVVGIDIPGIAAQLKVPEGHRVEAGIVIGKLGDKSILPEALAAREVPSPRKPLSEIAFEGGF